MATRALATKPADAAPAAEQQLRRVSILDAVASRYNMDPQGFAKTLRQTVFKDANNEEFAALLVVANEYRLNPLTKEIYAFKAQGGGIVPLVSIDGWLRIMNEHPQFDGIDYQDIPDEQGKLLAIECTIHRKDRTRPIKVIEYLAECKQNTKPWQSMPARMLRHKATIQCARYAFGFSGIFTEDDAEGMLGARRSQAGEVAPMRHATPSRALAAPQEERTDPDTDEVLDEETSRALDEQGFAAMEGRADDDHGDPNDGDEEDPAHAARADEMIAEINGRRSAMAVRNILTDRAADLAAMPECQAQRVRDAAAARQEAVA